MIVNEVTGEKLMERHPIRVKFEMGVYQTEDPKIIDLMLKRLVETKALGMAPTYSEYPDDNAKPVVQETKTDEKDDVIKIKDEIITDLQTELDKTKSEIEDLKKQIAELSQPKKPKKSPAVAN